MLKIWKRTWKASDDPRRVRDNDQEGILGGLSSIPSSGAATPPSDAILASISPLGDSRVKRTRTSKDQEDLVDDQPHKKPRRDRQPVSGSLGNHLPEISNVEKIESSVPSSISVFREQVMQQAKRENTIAVLPPLRTAFSFLVQFLTWAVENERSRPSQVFTRHRTALLVLDDESLVDKYSAGLDVEMPQFLVGKYGDDADPWPTLLQQDVVIVPSAFLLNALLKGTLAITQIHVLVICNAQNIQDQNSHAFLPLVQIMNDFYRITDPLSRPRIFALATPPADRGFSFDSAMLKLERTLDSKVVGVSAEKREEILALPDRPNEIIVLYDTLAQPTITNLFKQLQQWDPSESIFRKHFRASRHVLGEVGTCASDLIWRRALKEMESTVSPWYGADEDEDGKSPSTARKQQKMWETVKNWPFTMPNLDPSSRGFNITHKFLKLLKVLKSCEPYGKGFRGIVFVRRSAVAFVIVELLRTLDEQAGFLRPYALVGHGLDPAPNHLEVFRSFATGGYNLLIATQSVEDLEVPKACLVVRYAAFDIIESPVSQAYVRACTRGRESHLVHLAERGNDTHRRILSQTMRLDLNMLRWAESICNTPHSSVPPCTLRECVAPCHSDDDDDDDDSTREFLRDPTTSSRIYLEDATNVVYRFASNLPRNGEGVNSEQALFQFEDEQKEFDMPRTYICTVLLPETPVHRISGLPSTSKALARRTACYKVCEELAKMGLLDYRLFPLPLNLEAKNEPAGDSSNYRAGTRGYLRKHPEFWIKTVWTSTTLLYPIIISDHADDAMHPHSPFLILTRQPLPDLASVKLFFAGVAATINFKRGAPFQLDDARLTDLYRYTVRLVRIISNKPYVCSMADIVYFFAPLTMNWTSLKNNGAVLPNVVEHIPWDLVSLAGDKFAVPLKGGTLADREQDIKGAVVQDRWVEFTRRYDAVRMRPELTPLSKPSDSPREAEYDSLFDFCKARRKSFEGLQDYRQPIIEVSKVPNMLNRLDPTSRELISSTKMSAKYLIPELCAKLTIPAATYRSALLLPSIIRRINDFLLVKELNAKLFRHSISEDLLHVAICAPSAGYEYDYERLEMLGDAFLKYLSTVYVFVTYPSNSEGSLHAARLRIISNKALFQNASRVGLPAYIQAKPFTPRQWHPPNFELNQPSRAPDNNTPHGLIARVDVEVLQDLDAARQPSTDPALERSLSPTESPAVPVPPTKPKKKKKQQLEDRQWLGDKAIADVAEAVIGAAYVTGGRETALNVTKALGIPILHVDRWSDFGRKVLAPPPKYTARLKPESIAAIESIIGHKITRPHLLAQALTHSSTQGYELTSYERLEFIGDAILDFSASFYHLLRKLDWYIRAVVIRYIFDRDHQLSPGGLTLLKGAMVSNSVLAAICVRSGLYKHLLYESYALANGIREYVTKLAAKQASEYEAAERECRAPGQYWLDIEPPKALSDVVESIIGAIYISDNFMPFGVEAIFDNILKPFYNRHITLTTLSHHPTKLLFELFQARGCEQFSIQKERVENAIRCHVLVHDVILASGEDIVPAVAARRASLFALDALEGDAAFLTRTCDCRTISQTKKKRKKNALENVLLDFEEEEGKDILAVEKALTRVGNTSSGRASEEIELEEGMILE